MNHHRQRLLFAATALVLFGLVACSKAPAPAAAGAAASSATANVSDIDITEHVKTVLSQRDSMKGLDITVVTLKGDVRLTGVVDSQSQIDEALQIAKAAEGAHAIHDELTIRK